MIELALSSLLVRDGLVGVKRMEQAFQRQVIYGGALDTILLEMGAITEERLAEYLSLASGLPPADRNLYDYFDPRAVQVCPRELAEEFHVAPVAFDGDALRVLVLRPGRSRPSSRRWRRASARPSSRSSSPSSASRCIVERLFGVPTPSRYHVARRQAGGGAAAAGARAQGHRRGRRHPPRRRDQTRRTRTGPMSTDTVARALERHEHQRRMRLGGAGRRSRRADPTLVPAPVRDAPPGPVPRARTSTGQRAATPERGGDAAPARRASRGARRGAAGRPHGRAARRSCASPGAAAHPRSDAARAARRHGAAAPRRRIATRSSTRSSAACARAPATPRRWWCRARWPSAARPSATTGVRAGDRRRWRSRCRGRPRSSTAVRVGLAVHRPDRHRRAAPSIAVLARLGGVVPPSALILPVVIRDRASSRWSTRTAARSRCRSPRSPRSCRSPPTAATRSRAHRQGQVGGLRPRARAARRA